MQLAIHYPLPTCPSPTTPQLQFAPSPRQFLGQNLARRACMSHRLLLYCTNYHLPTASQPALALARFGPPPPTPVGKPPRPSPSFATPRRPTDPRQVLDRGETMTRAYLRHVLRSTHPAIPSAARKQRRRRVGAKKPPGKAGDASRPTCADAVRGERPKRALPSSLPSFALIDRSQGNDVAVSERAGGIVRVARYLFFFLWRPPWPCLSLPPAGGNA
ncbi:hypothetical protein BS50DRAFT_252885 [Corynespora cassiicola Philippines]|uniref:Uncharacterized protein n=1 Tax=Corynespora cassiicola Philippines TaxID=1448308 RepID=A0A2T2P4A3_CORCC|nr:hypothetical protein BS50DRAFT_252885 [Corynespora cassiicola Philippines]